MPQCLAGVLPSTMKQVGLGRGCIRVPMNPDVSTPRLATSSAAFNVDALVGRPNIVQGGHYTVDCLALKQLLHLQLSRQHNVDFQECSRRSMPNGLFVFFLHLV